MEKNTLERGESAGRDVLWLEGLAPPTTKHQEILSNSKNKGAIKRTNVLNVIFNISGFFLLDPSTHHSFKLAYLLYKYASLIHQVSLMHY